MTGPLRLVVVPVVVAVLVLAVVLGVMRLADDGGAGSSAAPGGAGGSVSPPPQSDSSAVPGRPGRATVEPSVRNPEEPLSRFTAVTRAPGDRSLEVRFWGGVEHCYRYTVRAAETADVVTLTLRERRTFEGACIDLAQQYDRTVPLERPLDLRRVVDGTTGETLLGPTR